MDTDQEDHMKITRDRSFVWVVPPIHGMGADRTVLVAPFRAGIEIWSNTTSEFIYAVRIV